MAEVKKEAIMLNLDSSSGINKIPVSILSGLPEVLSPVLSVVFTQSLSAGKLPTERKRTNICRIFENDSGLDPLNFSSNELSLYDMESNGMYTHETPLQGRGAILTNSPNDTFAQLPGATFTLMLEQARREAAQMALEAQAKDETSVGPTKVKPYLSNLNEDPQLSGVIQHLLVHKNVSRVVVLCEQTVCANSDKCDWLRRRQAGADDCVIGDKTQKVYWVHMQGLGIATEHAILIRHGKTGSKVELRVLEGVNKLTKVNGTPVRESVFLQHNDRILFGSHQLYLFKNPLAEKRDDGTETSDDLDWEYAQRELAEKTGFEAFEKKPKSKEDIILQKQLLELIPILAEANGIAEELGKNRTFDLLLVPPTAQGLVYGEKKETRIVIRMRDTTTNNIWLWDKDQFMEHRFTMQ
ncbi:unnamed protein product, partial [Calicophoron daubneyi]